MTGLPNRRAFDEQYANLISKGKPFGLLIFDLDNFKYFNDVHGHMVGDNVLTQVSFLAASSIRSKRDKNTSEDSIAKTGTLGRFGGDEFAVLLPDITNVDDLKRVAERLRTTIGNSPISVNKYGKTITLSAGDGIYNGEDAKEFFIRVDTQGLYKAKKKNNKVVIVSLKKK